ncbi:glycosyltransferase [Acidaminococcus sp. HCP3S3_H5]|uniref:glycosyltransferase n=1 Tax=Acidaminococcus sp. HCP3S3_H5 TaxID=3438733 RepID=UPI003F9199E6
MNVLIAADARLYRTPDGKVWCKTIYGYDFWTRYLAVFEDITIISRLGNATYDDVKGWLRSDGPHVNFKGMPMVRGSKGYIVHFLAFLISAIEASLKSDCAIIRLPSLSATFVELFYRWISKPYAIEVVADPQNAYAERPLIARVLSFFLRKACLKSNGVSYVTQFALQKDYPSKAHLQHHQTARYFESHYSSIILKNNFFAKPRIYGAMHNKIRLIHTANNMNNDVKGHDIVIKVIKKLFDDGIDANITFIGDGDRRKVLEQMAESLGIGDKVQFTGFLSSSDEVRSKLLEADLFIFPTKAEGLPRAIIEAMAVGLPCLSTPVNGIPELLPSRYMFNPMDVEGFTMAVERLIKHPEEMSQMSQTNVNKARNYEYDKLNERRRIFYTKLKKLVNVKC